MSLTMIDNGAGTVPLLIPNANPTIDGFAANPAWMRKTPIATRDGNARASEIGSYSATVTAGGLSRLRPVGIDLYGDSLETVKMFRNEELARGLGL